MHVILCRALVCWGAHSPPWHRPFNQNTTWSMAFCTAWSSRNTSHSPLQTAQYASSTFANCSASSRHVSLTSACAKVLIGKAKGWWPTIIKAHQTIKCRDGHVWVWNLGSHNFSQVQACDMLPFTGLCKCYALGASACLQLFFLA